jgi:hypothetical protein
MSDKIGAILRAIHDLEEQLEAELSRAGELWRYSIHERRVRFEASVAAYHRSLRKSLIRFIWEASIPDLLTAPLIYGMIFPLICMDLAVTVYQAICFPVYGIKKVSRSDFIALDRHSLQYLNSLEKLNCEYCGYANGLAGYFREVAARTEEYWCPIKHAERIKNPHSRYHNFVEYGDAEAFRRRVEEQKRGREKE